MADGRIVMDTEIDVSGAKEGVKNLTSEQIKVRNEYRKTAREIALLKEQIKDMETPKIDTSSLEKYETKLQETYDKLADLEAQARTIENEINASVPIGTSENRLQDMYEHSKAWKEVQQAADKAYMEAEKYEKEIEKIKSAKSTEIGTINYKKAVDTLANATERLDMLGKKTKEVDAKQDRLVSKLKSVGKEGKKSFNKAAGSAQKFAVRLRSIIASAFIFNVISSGLRSLTSYMGNALKRNKQFSDSVSAIKGNLLTAFQPIYDAVMPALNIFMAGLQKVTGYIASFINMLFGTSIKASSESAKELYEQSSALDSVSESARRANKQLSSIDELQVVNKSEDAENVSSGTGNSIVPSFSNIETIEELPEWLNKSLKTIRKLLEDWKIGDFFSVGEDVSDLVIQINEFIANAIANVEWGKLGKNVGAFLRGIKWGEIFLSLADIIVAAFQGMFKFAFSIFDEAPLETTLIALFAGLNIWSKGFTAKSTAKVILKVAFAIAAIDTLGTRLAKLISGNVAEILGDNTIFEYIFENGVVAGLEESAYALNLDGMFGLISQEINRQTEKINKQIETIELSRMQLNIDISNIEDAFAGAASLADEYFELSIKNNLTDEDIARLNELKTGIEEFAGLPQEYIDPITGAWKGTKDELSKVIEEQKKYLNLQAYQEAYVQAQKDLLKLENTMEGLKNQISDNEMYSKVSEWFDKLIEQGYTIDEILDKYTTGEEIFFGVGKLAPFGEQNIKDVAAIYKSLQKTNNEYKTQKKHLQQVEKEMSALGETATNTSEKQQEVIDSAEKSTDKIEEFGERTGQVSRNIAGMDFTVDVNTAESKKKINELDNLFNNLEKERTTKITADTASATEKTKTAKERIDKMLSNIYIPTLAVKTARIQETVNAAVSSANYTLSTLKQPNVSLNTSGLSDKVSQARQTIENGLKGINIGLQIKLQEKVKDAMTTAINIGKSAKLGIGQIKTYNPPYLASGAVIPPNKEFMAVLGDQKHGMNIEAPADLIKQMVVEGINESGTTGDSEIIVNVYLEGDAEGVFKLVKVENEKVRKQTGNSAFA